MKQTKQPYRRPELKELAPPPKEVAQGMPRPHMLVIQMSGGADLGLTNTQVSACCG